MRISTPICGLMAATRAVFATPLNPNQDTDSSWSPGQPVQIKTGTVQGASSKLRPEVSAYLGIPFGQPPIGDLRFEPPIPVKVLTGKNNVSSAPFDATQYGPDCPSNHIPTMEAYIAGTAGEKILTSVAQTGRPLSEDCLSVNVWTKPQIGEKKKAVLFWIFGGGFSIGNTAAEIYDGSVLADEEDVIVVSANYRVNVFGFSGAPGIQPNAGLLDQRLALEWTRDNIAAFGGDPSRITVFGQSAGGASTDFLNIMYPEDPIAHAFIPQSGVAAGGVAQLLSSPAGAESRWYDVSESLGCGDSDVGASASVSCVRGKMTADILQAVGDNTPFGVAIATGFAPTVDDVTAPEDAVDRIEEGQFAKVPMLVGSTVNEAAFILPVAIAYTSLGQDTVETIAPALKVVQPLLDIATQVAFTCGASQAAALRAEADVTTYRYQYHGGNYSNTYIRDIGSGYHIGELPVVFGTAEGVTGTEDQGAEIEMGRFIRKSWAAFAKDPENGLASLGWPKYSPDTSSLVRLAYGNETTPSVTSSDEVDTFCSVINEVLGVAGTVKTFLSSVEKAVESVISNGPKASDIASMMDGLEGDLNATSIQEVISRLLDFQF